MGSTIHHKVASTPLAKDSAGTVGPSRPASTGGFHPLEWNALVNRARALLQAQREEAEHPTGCPYCPHTAEGPCSQGRCRALYRQTVCQLMEMVDQAPHAQRPQLRRTVDSLHLAYRQLWEGRDTDG